MRTLSDRKPEGGGPGEMTLEQAIEILDPETTRDAMYAYEYYGGFHGEEAKVKACEQACRIAAEVMKKEVSRRRGEENPHCRECICRSCDLFQKTDCLEGTDHCITKCDHESHTRACPWHTDEREG